MKRRPKHSLDDLKVLAIVCASMAVLIAATLFISGVGSTQNNILSEAQVTPQTQSACFFCSITHFFQQVVRAVVQVVDSVGNELNSTACNILGGRIQTVLGSCSSSSSGGGSVSGPPAPAPPPATCGTDTTSTTDCGFSVSADRSSPSGSVVILAGDKATLAWSCPSSIGYTSSFGSGGAFDTGGGLSGTDSVQPAETTPYTLSCTAPAGNSTGTATVTITPVDISLTAATDRVARGSPALLSWSAGNLVAGVQCGITSTPAGVFGGSWNGSGTLWSGSGVSTEPINQQTVFTLSCVTSSGSSVSTSYTEELIPSEKEI